MLFFVTTKVSYVLTVEKPDLSDPDEAEMKELDTWDENDFLYKNYVLNGLSDDLYNYYNSDKSTKEIWQALQKKYDTKEAGARKYDVSRYLKYQMVDGKSMEAIS